MSFNKDKSGNEQQQQQSQTTTVQRTPEQIELDKLQLENFKGVNPQRQELDKNAFSLINQLLLGQSNLPGFLSQLPGGIDEGVTADIASNSIRDVQPFLQQGGLIDSGVNASVSGRIAGDVRRGSAEFNIGNLLNLLNLAVGGQAQVQQPSLAQSSLLSQRLAGAAGSTSVGQGSSSLRNFSSPSFLSRTNQSGRTVGSFFNFGGG